MSKSIKPRSQWLRVPEGMPAEDLATLRRQLADFDARTENAAGRVKWISVREVSGPAGFQRRMMSGRFLVCPTCRGSAALANSPRCATCASYGTVAKA